MLDRATDEAPGRVGGRPENGVGPTLRLAVGGGAVVLALAVLLYVLAVGFGDWVAGTPGQAMARLASAPPYREFAGLFLASFLAIFITREFGVRTR